MILERELGDWTDLEEIRPRLRAYLMHLCRDENEADDVLQETLLRAAAYRPGLENPTRLLYWARRIACNVFRDLRRRESRLRGGEDAQQWLDLLEGREGFPGEPDEEPDIEWESRILDREGVLNHLKRALGSMRRDDQKILRAFYFGDQTSKTTAQKSGVPIGLVKVRLFRARSRLRRRLRHLLATATLPCTVGSAD